MPVPTQVLNFIHWGSGSDSRISCLIWSLGYDGRAGNIQISHGAQTDFAELTLACGGFPGGRGRARALYSLELHGGIGRVCPAPASATAPAARWPVGLGGLWGSEACGARWCPPHPQTHPGILVLGFPAWRDNGVKMTLWR